MMELLSGKYIPRSWSRYETRCCTWRIEWYGLQLSLSLHTSSSFCQLFSWGFVGRLFRIQYCDGILYWFPLLWSLSLIPVLNVKLSGVHSIKNKNYQQQSRFPVDGDRYRRSWPDRMGIGHSRCYSKLIFGVWVPYSKSELSPLEEYTVSFDLQSARKEQRLHG